MARLEECGHDVSWLRFHSYWRGVKHFVCSVCHPYYRYNREATD